MPIIEELRTLLPDAEATARAGARLAPGLAPGMLVTLSGELGAGKTTLVRGMLRRLGWAGTVGSVRLSPFLGVNNLFNRAYVSSVVINAAQGRYYEPAPGRNLYVGFSLGAGE